MKIKWDPKKASANYTKHKIRFSDAESVLFDPFALTCPDSKAVVEERFITIGCDALQRIVLVVYTFRGDSIRLISARRATRKERKSYEEGI